MVATRLFTQPANNGLIQRAPNASHIFEAYTRLKDIFHHQKRQAVGQTVLNQLLIYLKEESTPERDAGQVIRENEAENPDWFIEMLEHNFASKGSWLIPRHIVRARFQRLENLPASQALLRLPVVLAAACFDLPVFMAANRTLKAGGYLQVWKDTKTTRLDK